MPWRERLAPRRMARVAVVAPDDRWRRVLEEVGDLGVVEPGHVPTAPERRSRGDAAPDELDRVSSGAVTRDGIRALAGWTPSDQVPVLQDRLRPLGGAAVEIDAPQGEQPPTLFTDEERARSLRPLVDTYATVPYLDLDPTWFAGAAYVVMFGMMFGDVGHGLMLVMAGVWLRITRREQLRSARSIWPLVVALGVSATIFGFLYGEFFGPTGVIPALWLQPLEEPGKLLVAGVAVGAALLAIADAIGVVNRWREGGIALALYSPSGIAGAGLFGSLALVAAGIYWDTSPLWIAGAVVALGSLVLVGIGLHAEAGPGAAGGLQTGVELVDVVIRLGSNLVSFARLAAFGLTHAALGQVIWDATTALWDGPSAVAAVVVFVVGNLLAFTLELLVAGVQALRLEYYELFSRIFVTEGQPFRPWHLAASHLEDPT